LRPAQPAGAARPHHRPRAVGGADFPAGHRGRPTYAAARPSARRGGCRVALLRRTPDCAAITALAHGSTAHVELTATDGGPRQDLVWSDNSISSGLARRLIEELAALEPNRLRRCARTACDLLFYDTTRSRTRRWHAEDPCGWRQRQQHRRTHR
jgi:predicted RNA-binding Zn ribbon-like protein